MIVVDASTALAWVLREREHADTAAALDYVSENGGCVPGNFHSEVAHGLLLAERKKRITEADVAHILSDLLALPLSVELPDVHVIIATARTYGLTCYDASYLALALQSHLPLATVDTNLAAAAKSAKCAWKPKST